MKVALRNYNLVKGRKENKRNLFDFVIKYLKF